MPYDVVKKPCTMSSGKRGNAVIYKLTDSGKEFVSCQINEEVAYSVVSKIETSEKVSSLIGNIANKIATT
jgi:hypothetical protein